MGWILGCWNSEWFLFADELLFSTTFSSSINCGIHILHCLELIWWFRRWNPGSQPCLLCTWKPLKELGQYQDWVFWPMICTSMSWQISFSSLQKQQEKLKRYRRLWKWLWKPTGTVAKLRSWEALIYCAGFLDYSLKDDAVNVGEKVLEFDWLGYTVANGCEWCFAPSWA